MRPLPPHPPPSILLVAPQPFFELRGTPINVLQMVNVLSGAGYEVHLATYAVGEQVAVPRMHHHRAPPVPWAPAVPIGFSGRKIAHDTALALRVWKLLLTHRFDVVHAVEEAVFFTLPLARLRGIPVIYDLDSCLSDQLSYSGKVRSRTLLRAVRGLERLALRQSRMAITVCQALTDVVRGLDPGIPIAQIEDSPLEGSDRPPDAATVERLRAEHNPGGKPLVVYTGNFASYQGLELLFNALPALMRACPGGRLLVVGGSTAEITLTREMLARRGLAGVVVFAGQQPPELMADFMALGDALVSPRREGQNTPLKLYNYMESGVPIVATDLPTHRQVLDDDSAVLCEPNPEALGAALGGVLCDPSTYAARGAAAQARVRRDYSRAAFERKLLAAYASVLAGPRSSVARSM